MVTVDVRGDIMYATQKILAFPHAPLDLVRSFPLKYRRQQVHLAKKIVKLIFI